MASYVDELSLKLTTKDQMSSQLKATRKELTDVERQMAKTRAELENTGSPQAAAELRKLEQRWTELTRAQAENRKASAANEAAMKRLRAQAEQSQTAAAKLGRAWTKTASVFNNDLVAGASAVGLALAGRKMLNAYAEAESQQAQLDLAYQKFPAAANMSIDALRSLNDELMRTTGADDDVLASSQAVLLRFGLTAKQVATLTPLVNDLAIAKGIALNDAALAVGKALQGQTRGLRDVGIVYKTTGDAATDLSNIQALLAEQVGGTAEAFGQTTAGEIKRAQEQYANLTEELGAQLVPALEAALAVATPVMETFSGMPEPVKATAVALGFVGSAALIATPRIQAMNTVLKGSALWAAHGGKLKGFALGIGAITAASIAAKAAQGDNRWLIETPGYYADAGAALRDLVQPGWYGQGVQNVFQGVGSSLFGIQSDLSKAKDKMSEFDTQLVDLVSQGRTDEAGRLFNELVSGSSEWGGSLEDVRGQLPGYIAALKGGSDAMGDYADETDDAAAANSRLGKSFDRLDATLQRRAALQGYRDALAAFIKKPSKEAADALLAATSGAAKSFAKPENAAKFTAKAMGQIADAADSPGIANSLEAYLLDPLRESNAEALLLLSRLNAVELRNRIPSGAVRNEFASGGPVFGPGTATSDSIPARLSNGEWVVRAASVDAMERAYGPGVMSAINNADRSRSRLSARLAPPKPTVPRVVIKAGTTQTLTTHVTAHGQVDYELAQRRMARKIERESRARYAGSR